MLDIDGQKMLAARWAVDQVSDGMVVGIGSGSTATMAVRRLAERVQQGLRLTGVATSIATDNLARRLGIPMLLFDESSHLDMAIDGADEVDPQLNLIKGLGGALLREKLVELTTKELTIIVDEGKLVPVLGSRSPIPVEIVPFGWRRTQARVEALGCKAVPRLHDNELFQTDSAHYILDCRFGPLSDPATIGSGLKALPGVVEHGLFLGLATRVVVGRADGSVEVHVRQE